jgi:5-methylcytosine-specific restriction enzyme A
LSLYGRKWNKVSRAYLAEHPFCRYCEQEGRQRRADVVDHIIPHRGDAYRFWQESNWQPLCTSHHNSTKQREEKTGLVVGCDADGIPLDPDHAWRKDNAENDVS